MKEYVPAVHLVSCLLVWSALSLQEQLFTKKKEKKMKEAKETNWRPVSKLEMKWSWNEDASQSSNELYMTGSLLNNRGFWGTKRSRACFCFLLNIGKINSVFNNCAKKICRFLLHIFSIKALACSRQALFIPVYKVIQNCWRPNES